MKNASPDATKIANVLNFTNVVEEFVLWRKNADLMMIVPRPNLAQLLFQVLVKGNVKMFVPDLLYVDEMPYAKLIITDLSVLVLKDFLVIQKMTK